MSEEQGIALFNAQDIEISEDTVVYKGHYEVHQLKLRHKCFDGQWSNTVVREQLKRHDAASAILYDPKEDKVVLVEQLRIGLINREDSPNPWLLEIVAGLIDQSNCPEETIHREAMEEAGCAIKKLIPIGKFYNTPGGFTELTYVYCGLISLDDKPLSNQPEPDEDIKIHVLKWNIALSLLQRGWITSASSLIALQWLEIQRPNLLALGSIE